MGDRQECACGAWSQRRPSRPVVSSALSGGREALVNSGGPSCHPLHGDLAARWLPRRCRSAQGVAGFLPCLLAVPPLHVKRRMRGREERARVLLRDVSQSPFLGPV